MEGKDLVSYSDVQPFRVIEACTLELRIVLPFYLMCTASK